MKILVDTAPVVATIHSGDSAHEMAKAAMRKLRRNAVLPSPVLVEADHLIRARSGPTAARLFLRAVARGHHEVAYMTANLLRRATELDDKYADLKLGFVDTSVMAIAERHEMPIFTFDFRGFRATQSATGPWRLAIDERLYLREIQP
ncbi:MAG TPA: PIN domain-containing protein [Solirubrobacterales bacterium]|nr:PIN domain-containing protein [Solirubrobacterales bacterium]